jgi:hypothetical protein
METNPLSQEKSREPYYLLLFGIVFAAVFTLIIWLVGPLVQPWIDTLIEDQGAAWYYWKLPLRNDTTMLIVWTLYLANQLLIWGAIYWASKNLTEYRTKPSPKLTRYNYATLIITAVFMGLHLLKTIYLFDGLAQDAPIWTSQGSVIVMLVFVLIIENPRRGIFLGRRAGKPITARVSGFFRRNHSYIISWALVYTFWFHPAVNDPQLISGFFYMFLLFTQMILAYTPVHLDKRWIVTLESYVAIHAVIVAYFNTTLLDSTDMWPMFFSGFAFMFVFTYMYALNIRKELRYLVTAVYIGFLAWLYLPTAYGGYGRGLEYLMRLEFIWIPAVLYGLAFVFAAIVYVLTRKREIKESA